MKQKILILILIIFSIIVLDQSTKWLARSYFTFTENQGVAFSIPLQGWQGIVINILLIMLFLHIVTTYMNWESKVTSICTTLILGGALSNLIDRVRFGFVTDFIKIGSWPIFNLADVSITLGVFLSLMYAKDLFITYNP